jgi:tetratricopeptide (TPR) repeat protein
VSIRLGLVAGLLVAILVTYLASINPGRAHLLLGGDWALDVPIMALVAGAVGIGAVLALVLGWLRDLVRGGTSAARATPPLPARAAAEPVSAAVPARAGRDALIDKGRWAEALAVQTQVVAAASREERSAEEAVLAGLHYEIGRERFERGELAGAAGSFKDALRLQPDFVPAALLLGEAHLRAGEPRDALRVWERAAEAMPSALPVLARIEERHREEGRPTRMISLYRTALDRHPDNLALAFGLGRVYFELAMLDEADEQFQKMEVRAADMPLIHAYLGAILERRGQYRDAMEEYRRALRLSESIQWPHHCAACGALHPRWVDRCPSCRRWNTSRP